VPVTPDRFPGVSDDEGIDLETTVTPPSVNGGLRYVTSLGFRFYEEGVLKGLGVSEYDFLLDCEPDSVTNTNTLTRTLGSVTKETWVNTATTKIIKTIDYTRSAGVVTVELVKVFAADGTTVVAQKTINYTRSGGNVTSIATTRNI
jgi:hypothetical protein